MNNPGHLVRPLRGGAARPNTPGWGEAAPGMPAKPPIGTFDHVPRWNCPAPDRRAAQSGFWTRASAHLMPPDSFMRSWD